MRIKKSGLRTGDLGIGKGEEKGEKKILIGKFAKFNCEKR